MHSLPKYQRDVRSFFERFPWLNQYTNWQNVRHTEVKKCDERILVHTPTIGNDFVGSDEILLLDKNGDKICEVSQVPGFSFWKIWKWWSNLVFSETVGQAILRVRKEGHDPNFIYFDTPNFEAPNGHHETKITLYTDLPKNIEA